MPTYRLTKLIRIVKTQQPSSDFRYSGNAQDVVATAWAEITPLSSSERLVADQVAAGSSHRIIIRWPHRTITSGMAVLCGESRYEIVSVLDVAGNGAFLELTCTRDVSADGKDTTR